MIHLYLYDKQPDWLFKSHHLNLAAKNGFHCRKGTLVFYKNDVIEIEI